MLDTLAVLVSLTALCAYLNHRFIRLPMAIGVMSLALAGSLLLLLAGGLGIGDLGTRAEALVATIDFNEVVMHGMLAALLFAGAMGVELERLRDQKLPIGLLASLGTLGATLLVGAGSYIIFSMLGLGIPFLYCLLFGALIAPTDPVAVLGILRSAGAPPSLETKITGESLFNDGVAVVVFTILLELATGEGGGLGHGLWLFVQEALGGVVFGMMLGTLGFWLIRSIDHHDVEVLLTLALVLGGYALAMRLHLSGPIAVVVAGLMIGNHGRVLAMSARTREHLDTFWAMVDEILNALLFVLIGLEVLILDLEPRYLVAVPLSIALVLLARLLSVGAPVVALRRMAGRDFTPHAVKLLTWGGLKGGISVALALALPAGPERELILVVTYGVVAFSILVQGLSIGRMVRGLLDERKLSPEPDDAASSGAQHGE